MEPLEFGLSKGHPVAGPGWVYAWIHGGRVFYVGATWLHPAARAELHLHGETDDSRSLAIRELVESWAESPVVVAVPVPSGLDRKALKVALIDRCRERGWLAAGFVGPGEESVPEKTSGEWLTDALAALGRHCG